jgi:hypothetical protein
MADEDDLVKGNFAEFGALTDHFTGGARIEEQIAVRERVTAVVLVRAELCTMNLTNAKGQPTCARVRPPNIAWRMSPGDRPNVR